MNSKTLFSKILIYSIWHPFPADSQGQYTENGDGSQYQIGSEIGTMYKRRILANCAEDIIWHIPREMDSGYKRALIARLRVQAMLYEKKRHALTSKVGIHILKGLSKEWGILTEGNIQSEGNGITHEFQFSDGERRLIAEKLFGNSVAKDIKAEFHAGVIDDIAGQGENV